MGGRSLTTRRGPPGMKKREFLSRFLFARGRALYGLIPADSYMLPPRVNSSKGLYYPRMLIRASTIFEVKIDFGAFFRVW